MKKYECLCHIDGKFHSCEHCNVFFMETKVGKEKKMLGQYIAELLKSVDEYAKEQKRN